MMQFKHTEEERQFLKDKVAKLKRENGLGSTLDSQVCANEHVIKQLEMFMNQKVCVGEKNVYFNPVMESIKNPSFRFSAYAE
ncbi:hypothetical protein IIK_05810 [Bacillus cereus VD102]|nr:hypothetical protein IIK_05810 [Bacillus cereus VD102]